MRGASPTATSSLGFTAQRSSAIWGKTETPAFATTNTVASAGSSEADSHRYWTESPCYPPVGEHTP